MRSRPTVLAAAALAISLAGSLAACGDDGKAPSVEDTSTASSSPTSSESPSSAASETATPTEPPTTDEARTAVTISIEGDRITPGGDRVEVARDGVVTLEITSDRAGELHVHSKPEQFVEFEAGTSTHKLVISAPGVVDVEEHESGRVVVQLEVR